MHIYVHIVHAEVHYFRALTEGLLLFDLALDFQGCPHKNR